MLEERDYLGEDAKIDGFTGRLTKKWGREESQLRTAIYISFVKDSDTMNFRKKIKKARQSVVRLSMSSVTSGGMSINSRGHGQQLSPGGASARKFSEYKKSVISVK